MDSFPELTTGRLKLRKLKFDDLPLVVKYASNRKISDNLLNVPHPYQEEDAIAWMNFAFQGFQIKDRFVFAIAIKDTNEFVGGIGLHIDKSANKAEMGYWIGVPYWNQGFATEAIASIIKFGFDSLNLNKIFATHFADNPASGSVLIKNRMIREGELKDHYQKDGLYKTVIQYRLTRQEYQELKP